MTNIFTHDIMFWIRDNQRIQTIRQLTHDRECDTEKNVIANSNGIMQRFTTQ